MRILLLILAALAIPGCATREVGTVRPSLTAAGVEAPPTAPCTSRKIVWVTIDGTSNTPVSRTAAARLHEMVEAFSYTRADGQLAIWYAEGVGSADHDVLGKVLGTGVDEDIKKAYAFVTQTWQPCDRLFLNGFSRGAYSVRALAGLLYMAGIPDLRALGDRERAKVVDDVFGAYRTRGAYPGVDGIGRRRADRIAAALARHGIGNSPDPRRTGGHGNAESAVVVEAMTIWDTVHAIGLPDGSEDPAEGPAFHLLTACNVRTIIHPLSLDDNRVYSFTPLLSGGPAATGACAPGLGQQNVSRSIREAWFSGAHADVGGTYSKGAMLDGELASISLNWVLDQLRDADCPNCATLLAIPPKLRIPEDRLTAVHDGKGSSQAYRGLYRQSRKPMVHWYHAYGGGVPPVIHASVLDRLEWLFALDHVTPGCNDLPAADKPVICAKELASHGLIPELLKGDCLQTTEWGYRLTTGSSCVQITGTRRRPVPDQLPQCERPAEPAWFEGWVYKDRFEDADRQIIQRVTIKVPYPPCARRP